MPAGLWAVLGAIACSIVVLMAIAFNAAPPNRGAVARDNTSVKVEMRRDGDVTHIVVSNSELSEVTMTFDFSTVNLKGSVEFPYTATFRPGSTEAFTLSPANEDLPWEYEYTNYFKLGSSVAVPDSYVYSLPYDEGATFRITQGYGGRFSHKGSNEYALDWKMPEGTPVRAARGGLVVKVKDDSDQGGGSIDYDRYNNYVLIRHADGTLGHYCHLKKDGVKVHAGEMVEVGDIIALSGNTGFSSGPHLHFSVFKTKNGRERESIPVRFHTEKKDAVILVEGRKYRAPAVRKVQTLVQGAMQNQNMQQQ